MLASIWKKIGMKISIMTAEEHDKIMSITSHLPHLIAFTIVGTAFNIDLKKRKNLLIIPLEALKILRELDHLIQRCGQISLFITKNICLKL